MPSADGHDDSLRIAGVADLDALVQLAVGFREYLGRAAPSEASFRASFAALLADPADEFALAVDAGGAPLAYAHCRYRPSAWLEGLEAELEDLFVRREARGRGVGRRLLAFAIERAAARGCRSIGLDTNERNAEALALYRSLGFASERARWRGGRQLWLERPLGRGGSA
jgi:ribosomal protein S18 acetylase RimI-like enzyme